MQAPSPRETELALERAASGDPGHLMRLARRMGGAWQTLEQAARWSDGAADALPSIAQLERAGREPGPQRYAATRAAHLCVRAHALRLDLAEATSSVAVVRKLAGVDGRGAAWAGIAEAWVHALQGGGDDETLKRVEGAAGRHELRLAVLEVAPLRALAAEAAGDLPGAVRAARRASRMARTESVLEAELLSNLVLARQRRRTGRPYLTTRILTALASVAPAAWRPWLGWELTLAAGLDLAWSAEAGSPTARLRALLEAAAAGRPSRFAEAAAALLERCRSTPLLATDAGELVELLDPKAGGSATVRSWKRGEVDAFPSGLDGTIAGEDRAGGTMVFVLAGPKHDPIRVASSAVPLLRHRGGPKPLGRTRRRQARSDATLAVIALAGPEGLDEGLLFERVYGHPYIRDLHRELLGVLLHRARARLGRHGEILRTDRVVRMPLIEALLIPDPRCASRFDDRVLRYLARVGSASAKDVAELLGVSTRKAQSALAGLVRDDACVCRRRGSSVDYSVDDTTFREPTRW